MNILLIVFSSFMLALSGALVPGPLFTITVSESFRRGFKAGPLIILGHGLLEILIICLLLFEVTPFLTEKNSRYIIGVVGGVILIAMGVMLLKDAGRVKLQLSSDGGRTGPHPVIAGILGSISNPYWTIWWVTIGLGYLLSSLRYGPAGVLAFFVGHISADLAWYSLISYTVSRGRNMLGEKGYRYMLYACGIFLMLFGGWFISGI